MATEAPEFDPASYKQRTREQWDAAAEAWHRRAPALRQWLGPTTELMLDMAEICAGHRVLDVGAGAGDQTLMAAKRVGATGYVLATDLSSHILTFEGADGFEAPYELLVGVGVK